MNKPLRTASGWELRLRLGGGVRLRLKMPPLSLDEAERRSSRLEQMRDWLVEAGEREAAIELLTDAALQTDDALFLEATLVAQELAAGAVKSPAPVAIRTFRDISEAWLDGRLHERYPDRVRPMGEKRLGQVTQRLGHICKSIGSIPLSRLTTADCEMALAALPKSIMTSTRSEYARLIPRVLNLAVLGGHLDHTPLPSKWAPGRGPRREFQLLYPSEDAQLVACKHVEFGRRLLWGFLVREGLRPSEAIDLTWRDLDLEKGTVVVPDSKTGKMRRWRMGEDVRRALSGYQEKTGAGGKQKVFPRLPAGPAVQFRADLKECELRRRELHVTTATSRNITVHDLRGTFVTIALACGRSLPWIMRRTGHTRTEMIDRYQRAVDFAVEHEMTWFSDLDVGLKGAQTGRMAAIKAAIPQILGVLGTLHDPSPAHDPSHVGAESSGQHHTLEASRPPTDDPGRKLDPGKTSAGVTRPSPRATPGTSGPPSDDPEESADTSPGAPAADPTLADLTATIRLAAQAGEWTLAARLQANLDRLTAGAAGVVSLDARRKGGA